MGLAIKKSLKSKLIDLAPRYNMDNVLFLSFEKNYGHSCTLSATDVVYSVSTLLDCGASMLERHGVSHYENVISFGNINDQRLEDVPDLGESGLVGAGAKTKSVAGAIADRVLHEIGNGENDSRHEWAKHFYLAYDALQKYFTLKQLSFIGARYFSLDLFSAYFGQNWNIHFG
jgi:hypothetical protein